MSQQFETPTRPDVAAGAVAQYLRVKTPGAIAAAGASDVSIGTMELPCLAAGPCTVRLRTAQGTRKMVASEAITAGNSVYAAAGGKIAATGTVFEGIALESATADNDVIEVLPAWAADLVAAAGITLPTVTFNGATTVNKLIVPDNLADALSIVEGANKYVTIVTTNAGEKITLAKSLELSGAIDLIFTGTTGQSEITVVTNLADALSIKDSAGDLIVITTTTGAQVLAITPKTTFATGVQITGQVAQNQGAPAAIADGDTAVTAANLAAKILTMAATAARAPTVPTGTAMNAAVAEGQSIDWSFINLAAGAHTITVTAAADHTLVGKMTLAQNEQGLFRTRVSAANTAITYRLA